MYSNYMNFLFVVRSLVSHYLCTLPITKCGTSLIWTMHSCYYPGTSIVWTAQIGHVACSLLRVVEKGGYGWMWTQTQKISKYTFTFTQSLFFIPNVVYTTVFASRSWLLSCHCTYPLIKAGVKHSTECHRPQYVVKM